MGFAIGCTPANLDEWIEADLNVLFDGLHGVGKTARVMEAFAKHLGNYVPLLDAEGNVVGEKYVPGKLGEDFLYFSCATLDPWVDLVGVPKEVTEIVNGKPMTYLKLVRPKAIAEAKVKAIFLDEYNRSPKKVRNAVMELIQFRSINGMDFPNLRMIWAAINPDDDPNLEFDVEPVDPAQKDRFDVQVSIAYEPDDEYFTAKYGSETAQAAIKWWQQLPPEIKFEVSPRRLDKAIKAVNQSLNLRFFLPKASNPQKLQMALKNGLPEERFRKLISTNNIAEARKWLARSNNLDAVQKIIVNEDAARKFALPLIDTERLSAMLARQQKVKDEVLTNPHHYKELIRELAAGAQNEKLKSDCQKLLKIIENSSGPEPVSSLSLEIKGLPATFTKREQISLEVNYKINEGKYPTLLDAKNDKDQPLYPPFTGDFDSEARRIAHFCNLSATNTYYRAQLVETLAGLATKPNMSKEEMIACFRFLEFYASNSSSNSVYRNTLVSLILNTLVSEYRKQVADLDSAKLYKIMPHIYFRYFGSSVARDEQFNKVVQSLAIQPKPESEQIDPVEVDPSISSIEI
jgi:MoxR-like ATPase